MKLRVLVTRGRPAVSVSVEEGSTLGRVREAVTAVGDDCELSLNGRDSLDSSCTLEELGIVSGDLLYVIHSTDTRQLTNGICDTSHVTKATKEVCGIGDTTSHLTDKPMLETVALHAPQFKSPSESGMECRHQHQHVSTDVECEPLEGASMEIGQTANQNKSELNTVCSGMESGHDCATESRTPVPASHFDSLLDGSCPIGAGQRGVRLLCLALHMLMLDAGFFSRKSSPAGVGVASSSGVCRWDYGTAISGEVGVTLVCAEMGPTLAVHVSATGLERCEAISSSLQLDVSTYVNTDPTNLATAPHKLLRSDRQLCRVFKDAIANRMNTEIRKSLGLPEVGTFMSLFPELKLLVMRQLTATSLLSLSRVCQELRILSGDGFLWRDLLIRDFGTRTSTKKGGNMSWKELYVQLYRLQLEEKRARQQRLLSLDMEPLGRLGPHVVYPPGFRVPGVIGGDYDLLPNPFAPPTYLPPFVGPHLAPRPRYDFRGPMSSNFQFPLPFFDCHSSSGAMDSKWSAPQAPAQHLSSWHNAGRGGFMRY